MKKNPIIIVAEDDPVELLLIKKTLAAHPGFIVHASTNATDGLALAVEHHADLIVSDYNMPDVNGFEFCKMVKQHPMLRGTMFILLTGLEDIDNKIKGLSLGADDYLTKPFHGGELISKINAFLRIKFLQDELSAEHAALATLNEELEMSFNGVIALLGNLIELRVPNAAARGRRAADIAVWIAEKFTLPADELQDLKYAALLHEIGKVSMPDSVLTKPVHEQNEHEREEIAHFPIRGQLITQSIPRLKAVSILIRHQMENFDGTGLPDRLMRTEIPFGARVLRVINAVEHVLSTTAVDMVAVKDELLTRKGSWFDPQIAMMVNDYLQIASQHFVVEGKRHITVLELIQGMKIARDLYTASGVKLLTENTVLSGNTIDRILAHHRFDPILSGVYIYE
ncbi:MAG TPA: HD domain-containing phosphohydrolase [Bacteroidota bacterium]|nr:HD domain-containing phosphohydrolase [Bacteroidota bacterium]